VYTVVEATNMLSAAEMVQKLEGVPEGAPVFVSYLAGREPTDRAVREASRARREGYAPRHFFGKVHRVWSTKGSEFSSGSERENISSFQRKNQEPFFRS